MSGRKRRQREEPCHICNHFHDVSSWMEGRVSAAPGEGEGEERERERGDGVVDDGSMDDASSFRSLPPSLFFFPSFFLNLFLFPKNNDSTRAASPAPPAATGWRPRRPWRRRWQQRRAEEASKAEAEAEKAGATLRPRTRCPGPRRAPGRSMPGSSSGPTTTPRGTRC